MALKISAALTGWFLVYTKAWNWNLTQWIMFLLLAAGIAITVRLYLFLWRLLGTRNQ